MPVVLNAIWSTPLGLRAPKDNIRALAKIIFLRVTFKHTSLDTRLLMTSSKPQSMAGRLSGIGPCQVVLLYSEVPQRLW